MPTEFECTVCSAVLEQPESMAGKQVKCPECRALLTVPGTPPAAPPTSFGVPSRSRAEPPEDFAPRRRREEEYEDDDRDDTYDEAPRSRRRRPVRTSFDRGFRCPFCGTDDPPLTSKQISAAGWITFAVMMVFCFPLFWIGLLMNEEKHRCRDCGRTLN